MKSSSELSTEDSVELGARELIDLKYASLNAIDEGADTDTYVCNVLKALMRLLVSTPPQVVLKCISILREVSLSLT